MSDDNHIVNMAVMILAEMTGKDPEEIRAAAECEYVRLLEEGRIVEMDTPFGTIQMLTTPLMKIPAEAGEGEG